MDAGSNSKTQKSFDNVTNPPLITASADKLILEILCVPELHLLLGINKQLKKQNKNSVLFRCSRKMLKEFERKVFCSKKAGKKFMDNYLKKVGLLKNPIYPYMS